MWKTEYCAPGHTDDSTTVTKGANPGNFQTLLDLCCDTGYSVLKERTQHASRNATYKSKSAPNDLIESIAELIKVRILAHIKQNQFFSVLGDEAQDVSNKEQLPLVLRYVDNGEQLRDFMGFLVYYKGIIGQAIANFVQFAIQKLCLNMVLCRGQCYDGAGNMTGKNHQVEVTRSHIYTLPILNLAVVNACKVQNIRNMIGTLLEAGLFFNSSPLRQDVLNKPVEQIEPESMKPKLVSLCKSLHGSRGWMLWR